MATDFDNAVRAAQMFECAVGVQLGDVTGSIEITLVWVDERRCDKESTVGVDGGLNVVEQLIAAALCSVTIGNATGFGRP